ncbi:hypothetical protein GLOTRDRAFT_72177 [Gloeophyllum trabeum ATCC 11539]|uniref:Nuclear rim protein 1 n=1 Tax=Gloeophyllum trabeum (strain ATCC 11539 / FP-39264 / Madison 617) TaxID=670483 RepID=S7RXM3_GLOTA|nr:uncharacterized protein GLOTRDRAFT_72177 [Gloeophyllum trabeum ATCC 11539]EPQ58114.1 hypothetical protein GLOTRDRAFT_72177 [Gloeophyllum trabeum ATCC 11539]
MSLRRFAHANTATNGFGSPNKSASSSAQTSPNVASPPRTPVNRGRTSLVYSPSATPSRYSAVPFDWDAARTRKPPPYASPLSAKKPKPRKSEGGAPVRRVVRKKSLVERITSIPSTIAFQLSLFPHNVPLPKPETSAILSGGLLHFLHLCVRISRIQKVPDSDLGWEDMYREGEDEPWFDWTIPTSLLLIAAAMGNAMYLFTRVRIYRLYNQPDPVSSPHAKFVPMDLDFSPLEPPSAISRIRSASWKAFVAFWRFLLNMSPRGSSTSKEPDKVQQLEVWAPGEFELRLFCIYSPVAPFLWMATNTSNWMLMIFIMAAVGVQLHTQMSFYDALLKDRQIISEEVMHEYNDKFVYPRVHPLKREIGVMTHESEMIPNRFDR